MSGLTLQTLIVIPSTSFCCLRLCDLWCAYSPLPMKPVVLASICKLTFTCVIDWYNVHDDVQGAYIEAIREEHGKRHFWLIFYEWRPNESAVYPIVYTIETVIRGTIDPFWLDNSQLSRRHGLILTNVHMISLLPTSQLVHRLMPALSSIYWDELFLFFR